MPHVGSEIDANFYRLIHQMLDSPRDEKRLEQRSDKRRDYRTAQRIARWDGGPIPDEDQFVAIQCRDLTRSGLSFLTPTEPHFSTIVVEFGAAPDVFYVAAQIVRGVPVMCYPSGFVTPINDGGVATLTGPPGETGKAMFLVGCRFTRRLRKPA